MAPLQSPARWLTACLMGLRGVSPIVPEPPCTSTPQVAPFHPVTRILRLHVDFQQESALDPQLPGRSVQTPPLGRARAWGLATAHGAVDGSGRLDTPGGEAGPPGAHPPPRVLERTAFPTRRLYTLLAVQARKYALDAADVAQQAESVPRAAAPRPTTARCTGHLSPPQLAAPASSGGARRAWPILCTCGSRPGQSAPVRSQRQRGRRLTVSPVVSTASGAAASPAASHPTLRWGVHTDAPGDGDVDLSRHLIKVRTAPHPPIHPLPLPLYPLPPTPYYPLPHTPYPPPRAWGFVRRGSRQSTVSRGGGSV